MRWARFICPRQRRFRASRSRACQRRSTLQPSIFSLIKVAQFRAEWDAREHAPKRRTATGQGALGAGCTMTSVKPILVTGAAGLIGNKVRQILDERGDRVIAVDRQTGFDTFGQVIQCDLGDVHRVHELTRDGISGVIHCGAHSGPMLARDNPYSMVQVNIVGTANMLEVARVHKATRFIYCSSTSAYGPTPPGPVPEDVTMRPSTVYGATKVAGEQLVCTYASQYKLNGTSLRLSWVYGPRRTTDCVIRTMITDAQAGRPTRVRFGRDFPRQYIHVEDAAAALVMAFERLCCRGASTQSPVVP